jgi:carbamoyl-phosphate synthase small subunit
MHEKKDAKLVLEDGSIFHGFSFGAKKSSAGEVVFSTGMVGYPESLTDPSFKGQILCLTYPLIGNYGIPSDEKDEYGLCKFFESKKIQVQGLIISNYSEEYSHWNAKKSLGQWLSENDVPGIFGIDTRALTKLLREKGCMLGKMVIEGNVSFHDPNKEDLVNQVSVDKPIVYSPKNKKKSVVLVDCGAKDNIVRCLLKRNIEVIRVPYDFDFLSQEYDGILISNGPGDPKTCVKTIANIKKALQQKKPIFGICLGNQLLALAAGADTYKLKYGHRGQNQPCVMEGTKRCIITTQNHGFAVDTRKLGRDWMSYFTNANDSTNEGIKHRTKPFFSVQFHPEATPGPVDAEFLFDDFIKLL